MHEQDYYGDRFKWFVGVVKERSDDNMVRVRVFGIHRMDDVTDVSDGDLPWAIVVMPTAGGQSSSSNMSISMDVGDWVVGFFADGDDCQQPVVLGVLGGTVYSDSTSPTTGDGGEDTGGAGRIADTTLAGRKTRDKVYIFLKAEWLKRLQGDSEQAHRLTCAMMGHLEQESSYVYNIAAESKDDYTYGMVQWADQKRKGRMIRARRSQLFKHFGYPPPPPAAVKNGPGLAEQLSFIFYELDHSYRTAYTKLVNAKSLYTAVEAFSLYEGHYGVKDGKVDHRLDYSIGAWKKRYDYAVGFDNTYRNFSNESAENVPNRDV